VLEGNMVAGAERVGILLKGDLCEGSSLGAQYKHSILNNTVYSSLAGVVTFPDYGLTLPCIRLRNFTVFKSSHWGIYYQKSSSLILESNVLVDNQINLFGIVIEPSPLTHEVASKSMVVRNSIIVGQSLSFDCLRDVKPDDLNFKLATSITAIGAGSSNTGKIGILWGNFLAASNQAPYYPW
jgi:hypothetical protein